MSGAIDSGLVVSRRAFLVGLGASAAAMAVPVPAWLGHAEAAGRPKTAVMVLHVRTPEGWVGVGAVERVEVTNAGFWYSGPDGVISARAPAPTADAELILYGGNPEHAAAFAENVHPALLDGARREFSISLDEESSVEISGQLRWIKHEVGRDVHRVHLSLVGCSFVG